MALGRFRHSKGSAYSLTLIGIRILAENDHANSLEGAVLERAEYILLDRVDVALHFGRASTPFRYFADSSFFRLFILGTISKLTLHRKKAPLPNDNWRNRRLYSLILW